MQKLYATAKFDIDKLDASRRPKIIAAMKRTLAFYKGETLDTFLTKDLGICYNVGRITGEHRDCVYAFDLAYPFRESYCDDPLAARIEFLEAFLQEHGEEGSTL